MAATTGDTLGAEERQCPGSSFQLRGRLDIIRRDIGAPSDDRPVHLEHLLRPQLRPDLLAQQRREVGTAAGFGVAALAGGLHGHLTVQSGWRLRGYRDADGVEYVEIIVKALPEATT